MTKTYLEILHCVCANPVATDFHKQTLLKNKMLKQAMRYKWGSYKGTNTGMIQKWSKLVESGIPVWVIWCQR